ncbi:expressed unknown protein [Seminavis robusta]|uniref:Uncharacterized protein n=1 Tax=Seminavis robusta TaxID=568900 RepID=A0A9N8ECL5_9STRA|nr:expressed unknown protein [Seminavis robusta]|eukprot:Sro802_g204740.1 n/a (141) ;mRNA; r:46906-47328
MEPLSILSKHYGHEEEERNNLLSTASIINIPSIRTHCSSAYRWCRSRVSWQTMLEAVVLWTALILLLVKITYHTPQPPETVQLFGTNYTVANTTYIVQTSQGLRGSIATEIGFLTALTRLKISQNQLSQSIPSERIAHKI